MKIERFRWWHIAEVLPIEKDLFGPEKWSAGMFWSELAQRHYYLVAVQDERVAGYAGLAIVDHHESWVQNLAVRRDAQKRGIGRALLEATMEAARERGATHIDLTTSVDDTAAIGLYESSGFTNNEGDPDGPSMIYYEREL
ncbi:MAG TPA: GNAT family N-acetyltransferase [Actinoplanes sp.]|nr:GNAT family N-acetyltransferase [Actinoplanes sp.]